MGRLTWYKRVDLAVQACTRLNKRLVVIGGGGELDKLRAMAGPTIEFKGGGLSDMFGGGLTQNAGTSGVAEKNLNRWTIFIALVWVAIIIALGLMTKFNLV